MTIVDVVLAKKATFDGHWEILDEIPIGKKYKADLDKIWIQESLNKNTGLVKKHEVIAVENDDGSWGSMPTEILAIEVKVEPFDQ